jgi:DNA-binding FadR family transcriptional regulator
MFKPVEKKSLADAVFEQLRDQIVSGRMEPGEALPAERVLSEQLDVNRGAVREALKRLEQARLVSIRQGGATRVLDYRTNAGTDLLAELLMNSNGEINTKVARSVMEMRSALGSDIARLCAKRGGDEIDDQLEDILERMDSNAGELPALQELAMEFWATLVEGADNVAYQLAFNSLRETYSKFQGILAGFFADELTDRQTHRLIAQAVREGREDDAEFYARDLVKLGESLISDLMDALETSGAASSS